MQTFNREGSNWLPIETREESNKDFKWEIIIAKWSGFGPRPLWADKTREFVFNRIRKADGFRY